MTPMQHRFNSLLGSREFLARLKGDATSGDGLITLQFVLGKGLGLSRG